MKNNLCTHNGVRIIAYILYFALSALYTLSSWLQIHWFIYLKVIPLVIMMALLIPYRDLPYRKLVIAALVFGLIGDLVLEHGGQDMFPIGAGAFLINQILYNLYFLSLWGKGDGQHLFKRRYIAFLVTAVVIGLSSVNISTALFDTTKQKDRLLVVMLPIYAVFLNFTAILPFIVNLAQRKFNLHMICLIIGGVSYFISDSVLGRKKMTNDTIFQQRMYDSFLIMGTYYLAQYFIPLGAMYQTKKEYNQEDSSLIQSQIE